MEQKFHTGTYLGVTAELLNSEVNRVDGAYNYDVTSDPLDPVAVPTSGLRERLKYREPSLSVTANQLIGRDWSLGGRYRYGQAVLNDNFLNIPDSPFSSDFVNRQRLEARLQQIDLFAIYNHPCGFFAEGEALWYGQNNIGYQGAEPGDDFWQFNGLVGYRFPRRRAELTLALLNITGQDYKLNPLNIYNELPRERTLAVQFSVNF